MGDAERAGQEPASEKEKDMTIVLTTYVLCALSFTFGFLVRGLFALRDIRELDELRAAKGQRDAEVALLKRMSER